MRRYDEPIEVRPGAGGQPVAFRWRRRRWRVLEIERRWRETAPWWLLRDGDPASGVEADLLAEAEVLRVVASPGGPAQPGVYELAHPVGGDAWFLRSVVD